jgi:hypothetical protein
MHLVEFVGAWANIVRTILLAPTMRKNSKIDLKERYLEKFNLPTPQ